MFNRTFRTLSANLNGLNLGTRSFAINAGVNMVADSPRIRTCGGDPSQPTMDPQTPQGAPEAWRLVEHDSHVNPVDTVERETMPQCSETPGTVTWIRSLTSAIPGTFAPNVVTRSRDAKSWNSVSDAKGQARPDSWPKMAKSHASVSVPVVRTVVLDSKSPLEAKPLSDSDRLRPHRLRRTVVHANSIGGLNSKLPLSLSRKLSLRSSARLTDWGRGHSSSHHPRHSVAQHATATSIGSKQKTAFQFKTMTQTRPAISMPPYRSSAYPAAYRAPVQTVPLAFAPNPVPQNSW